MMVRNGAIRNPDLWSKMQKTGDSWDKGVTWDGPGSPHDQIDRTQEQRVTSRHAEPSTVISHFSLPLCVRKQMVQSGASPCGEAELGLLYAS